MTRAIIHPDEIKRQRERGWPDIHPEDFCHRCGASFAPWYTDHATWLAGTKSWAAETGREGICCVSCFAEMYERETGKRCQWRVVAEVEPMNLVTGDSFDR